MRLRYSKRAARQIEQALDYIAARSPQGASSVRARLQTVAILLQEHPLAGTATSRPGVRRFVLAPYPYFIDYRVAGDDLIVMQFRHSARKPVA